MGAGPSPGSNDVFEPPVVMGKEKLMRLRGHGTASKPVQEDLRWGCDALLADDICHFNRHGSEEAGYWRRTALGPELRQVKRLSFYDSNTGRRLFEAPGGRSIEAFSCETRDHGWPSFRDEEVNWDEVRILPGGEAVSRFGTHLGHNIPDKSGNRYCINLVSVAGRPCRSAMLPCCQRRRLQRARLPPIDQDNHYVLRDHRFKPPFPEGFSICAFAVGCYWSAEKSFWRLPGVYSTAVGYCGGRADAVDPSYFYVCTGDSGHKEAVQVVWDPAVITFGDLLHHFWTCHDPTQGNGQGRDVGSNYRSGIFCVDKQQVAAATASLRAFGAVLGCSGYPEITTEVRLHCPFYFADVHHQQYAAKPARTPYCSAEPTGVPVPGFETWDWTSAEAADPEALRAHQDFKPKLSRDFWDSYCWSFDSPNDQLTLRTEEIAKRLATLQAKKDMHAKRVMEVTSKHSVILQYCASCSSARRAVSLAGFLQRTCGVNVGCVPDVSVTGNFDVLVGPLCQPHSVVHSKSRGDGFVDSIEKIERVMHCIAKAPECTATCTFNDIAAMANNFPDFRRAASPANKFVLDLPDSEAPPQPPGSATFFNGSTLHDSKAFGA